MQLATVPFTHTERLLFGGLGGVLYSGNIISLAGGLLALPSIRWVKLMSITLDMEDLRTLFGQCTSTLDLPALDLVALSTLPLHLGTQFPTQHCIALKSFEIRGQQYSEDPAWFLHPL